MNKQAIIHGKNTLPGLLLCVLAWLFAIQPAHAQGGHWTFDSDNTPFDNYMTINAYIVLDGTEVESTRFEIAAFIGDECRGTYILTAQTWGGHNYPCFLPVWGKASENGQAVTVKVYDHSTGTEYEANEKPPYEYNGILGGFDEDLNPVPLYQLTINSDPNNQVYNLSIVPSQNGSVSANPSSGLPGTLITLTQTPATGYELDAVSAYKTNEPATTVVLSGTGNTRTFTMPMHNVTVEASFKKTAGLIAVEAAAALIAGGSYTLAQEYAENEAALKDWLVAYINSLPEMSATGITLTAANITITAFNAAVKGSKTTVSGTNGSFRFTVSLSQGGVQQTTPEKSGIIIATAYVEPAKWSVTIGQLSNGTVTAAPEVAEAGEVITLTIAPTSGYELKSISAYKTGETTHTVALSGSGLSRTFTMPAFPVTVSAVFGKTQATLDAEAVASAVSLIENGNYNFHQADGNTEATIKQQLLDRINGLISETGITITANDITLGNFTAAVAGSAISPTSTDGGFSFTVSLTKGDSQTTTAAKNGTIIGTVYTPPEKYSVTVSQVANGTVTASPDVAEANEPITLTIAPASGYELKSISVFKTGETSNTVVLSGEGLSRTFTMPAYPVTVSVVFGKTQATLDAESVASAVSLIENGVYNFLQADGNTEDAIKQQLVDRINSLISGTGITVSANDIILSNFAEAIAGSPASPNGTSGGFTFTADINKGLSSVTTVAKNGAISATVYLPPEKYSITVLQPSNGTVTANPDVAEAGEIITLAIAPTSGYELKSISACKTGDAASTVVLSGSGLTRTFTMPVYPVSVSAVFGKTQATLDAEAVATAISLIENAAYNFIQADGNTEAAIKQQLVSRINGLISGTGITVAANDITLSNFMAAVTGSAVSPNSTDGSFSFTVGLSKGDNRATTAVKNGIITATIYTPPGKYSVTVLQPSNGTVTAGPNVAEAGEIITLTIAPTSGYELTSISAYKTGEMATSIVLSGSGLTRTFAMPSYSVTVSAIFGKTQATLDAESVTTAVSLIENLTYNFIQADGNTEATIKQQLVDRINSLISGTGIAVSSNDIILGNFMAAIAGSSVLPNGTNGSFTFTVDISKGLSSTITVSENGVIAATVYIPPGKYSVAVLQPSNGTVTAGPNVAEAGEAITLTIAPASGYELTAISAYKTGETATSIVLSGGGLTRTFTMPAYPVTVSAVFGKTQATLDAESVASVASLIENTVYSFLQANGNTEEAIKQQLVDRINSLTSGTGIMVSADDIILGNFTAAVAGSPSGVDGGFSFSVNLNKGSTSQTTNEMSGVIKANSSTGINDNYEEKTLKAYLQNGILHISGLTAGKQLTVYNTSGMPIYQSIAASVEANVQLSTRGLYIVISGSSSVKVMY